MQVGDVGPHARDGCGPGRGSGGVHYLVDLFDPPVNAVEGPAVGDVIHQQDSLQGK